MKWASEEIRNLHVILSFYPITNTEHEGHSQLLWPQGPSSVLGFWSEKMSVFWEFSISAGVLVG